MLLKISTLKTNYEKCAPSRLKRMFQADINYNSYDEFVPAAKNQIVGNLPPEMLKYIIENFPEQKAAMIKKFHKGLGITAMFMRSNWRKMQREQKISRFLDELPQKDLDILLTQMRNILKSNINNMLPLNSSIQFNLAGSGAMGHVFQLSIKDAAGKKLMPDAAMKIFHNVKNDIVSQMHGNYAEANISMFLKNALGHNMAKSQFSAHYMSDLKAGYSLSEFIHRDGDYPLRFRDYTRMFGINSMDAVKNFIGGRIFDMGGFQKLWNFTSDKVTRRYYKKLMNHPELAPQLLERYQRLAENPKTPHREKILDAIDLYCLSKIDKRDYIKEYQDIWKNILTQD